MLAVALLLLMPSPASAGVADDLRAAQTKANRAAAELARAQTELARAENRVAELRARAADTRNRLSSLQTAVQDAAVRQYVSGGVETNWVLAEDLNSAVRANEMAVIVTVGAVDAIDRYRAVREDLEAATTDLTRTAEERRSALRALRERRARAVAEVERLARVQRELEAKARAEAARRARASQRRAAPGGRATPVPRVTPVGVPRIIGSGNWICPVQGPHAFSDDYGDPRSGGRRHQGNDILAPRGTPVVASVGGTVKPHNSSLGGLSYYLHGDDGNTYFGTHLDSLGARGRVAAGTVVGTVGNTGNARGGPTHLHFEIHPGGGGPVNPYATLVRYC